MSGFWVRLAKTTGRETKFFVPSAQPGKPKKSGKSRAMRGGDLRKQILPRPLTCWIALRAVLVAVKRCSRGRGTGGRAPCWGAVRRQRGKAPPLIKIRQRSRSHFSSLTALKGVGQGRGGDYDTPPCVFLVPRKLRKQETLVAQGFEGFFFLEQGFSKMRVCSKKNG